MSANDEVRELLERQIAGGRQIGVQVCAYRRGEPFVDVAAGTMGPGDDRPVQPDSLFCSFSSTKGVAALVVHQLADRGLLDYDAPVASYWPDFAQHGKDRLTVAQALSHQGGIHALPEPFRPEHITDWEAGIERTAAAVPAWEPGTATGYHAVTYGWIVGGIVAGVTGRHVRDVIRDDVAAPLGIADELHVGIPDDPAIEPRLTTLELVAAGEGLPIPEDAPFYEAMPKAMWPHFNGLPFRRACLPSGNGHFSARALARVYAALANGGELDGVRLVSPERIAAMQTVRTAEVDRVLGVAIRKDTGFFLGGLGPDLAGNLVHGPMGPSERAFGHPGAGGSVGFADPDSGLAVAVTLNKMSYPMPGEGVTLEICDLIRSLV
ncbi:MAG: beta-lactamase family protein [Acidimicrobiia bacterium]|nr:beta-lactamase family protein [Acidimicrobiia bacterium]